MTFREIYLREKQKPLPITPAHAFLKQISEVTKKNVQSVRNWVSGAVQPDGLTKAAISKYLKVPEDELFPPKTKL